MEKFKTELERVVNETRAEMVAVARQRVGYDTAEDVVQEALIEVYEVGGSIDKDCLLRLLDRVCERFRGRHRRSREVGFEELGDMPAPAAHTSLLDEVVAQMAALDLTDLQRNIIQWRLEGTKTRDIAEGLCIRQRMVQAHLRACGPRLRGLDVRDLGFASAQAMFDFCAHQVVYRAPLKTGSALANERQARLR